MTKVDDKTVPDPIETLVRADSVFPPFKLNTPMPSGTEVPRKVIKTAEALISGAPSKPKAQLVGLASKPKNQLPLK